MRIALTAHILTRAKSERGASLSVALLLMLVCVALTAAVLAASTASAGRFANQSEMDQRYYAVTSAVHLFSDSLGDGDKLTFTAEQEKTGWREVNQSGVSTDKWTSVNLKEWDDEPKLRKGFDFLYEITQYALFGERVTKDSNLLTDDTGSAGWIEPFSSGLWNNGRITQKKISYTIEADADAPDAFKKLPPVVVEASLKNDWTLDLDFHNQVTAESQDNKVFHIYMRLVGSYNEVVSPMSIDSDKQNRLFLKQPRTSTVTWQLQQVLPGEGVANGS